MLAVRSRSRRKGEGTYQPGKQVTLPKRDSKALAK
jgi:hypothetical protein